MLISSADAVTSVFSYPTLVIISVEPMGTLMEKFPLALVDTPFDFPFKEMLADSTGMLLPASVTFPVIFTSCAFTPISVAKSRRNKLIDFFIIAVLFFE